MTLGVRAKVGDFEEPPAGLRGLDYEFDAFSRS